MELIVISDTRMKIMLSREDMSNYRIDASTLDTESARTRRILYGILDDANRSAGLKSFGERAFVRVFPSRDGGCEMYVTRFSELSDVEVADGEGCAYMSNTKNAVKRRSIFRFEDMGELLCACKALERRGYSEKSDLYISHETGYLYLILHDGEGELSVALEYADPLFFGGALLYISEHSVPLCENNAVGLLSKLC